MSFINFLDSIGRDFRRALRVLQRRPSFTMAAVLTLALGIGATTAIFSVVYSVLLKPLPYPSSGELVRIRHVATALGTADAGSHPSLYLTYRDENRTLSAVGFWGDGGETLTRADGTDRVRSLRVTHGVLQALGVEPLRGRWFTATEHEPGTTGPDPVILSYAFAQSRFGGEAALGRDIEVNGRPAEVVGIMPSDFRFLDMSPPFEVIVAIRLDPASMAIGTFGNFHGLARLRPGVTPEQASADLARMLPLWLDAWPIAQGLSLTREAIGNWRIRPVVRPLKDDMVGDVAGALWVVMGAIGAVLLVACANIANLMLVRADARRSELAVRAALGAVPARIARELLVESLVIGAIGAALGLALAYGCLELLVAVGPGNLPRLEEIGVHMPVLGFTAAVALVATLAFGSVTAVKHAFAPDLGQLGAARTAGTSSERSATRSALVVVQVALALVLVIGAALMLRTFQALRDVEPGFVEAGTIQTVRTWAPNDVIRDATRYVPLQREILAAIESVPGVTAAGFTSVLPMEGGPFVINQPIVVEGRPLDAGEAPTQRRIKFVSPGYLDAMGTQLVAGRHLTWADVEAGGRVVLISETFARELGAEPADAIGKRIRPPVDGDDWREIVGVVENVKEDSLFAEAPSIVYWPALLRNAFGSAAQGYPAMAYVVRSERAGTAALTNEIREAIWSVNRDVPVALDRTMQQLYAGALAQTSFALVMLAIAGTMALVLGIIGIYGVIAYVVAQRAREIGIRMALGAPVREVRAMVVRQGLGLSALGLAIGVVAALALTRLMASLLFGVEATDVATYVAAVGVILAAAAFATYLPARRASAIDPIEVLKAE